LVRRRCHRVNEAFAVQSLACIDAWGIDPTLVNANGGAISLGHPLGAFGGRILGTLAKRLALTGERCGVAAICIATARDPVVLETSHRRSSIVTAVPVRRSGRGGRRHHHRIGRPDRRFRMAGMPVELIDALIHAESVTSPLEVCVLGAFPASTSGDFLGLGHGQWPVGDLACLVVG